MNLISGLARVTRVFGSFFWSITNAVVRTVVTFLLKPAPLLPGLRPDQRVISVGNFEAGGTGKTPLVGFIAEQGILKEKRVAVLSRGYGRTASGVFLWSPEKKLNPDTVEQMGDEMTMLAGQFPKVWIGVGSDRRAVAQALIQRVPDLDWFILDDGLQQFGLLRDIDVIAVTSNSFFGGRAWFREFSGVVKSLASLTSKQRIWVWTKGEVYPQGLKFDSSSETVMQAKGVQINLQELNLRAQGRPMSLLTSIANAEGVLAALRAKGFELENHYSFCDHARLEEKKIRPILEKIKTDGKLLVVTEKDWVKLEPWAGEYLSHVFVIKFRFEFKAEEMNKWNIFLS